MTIYQTKLKAGFIVNKVHAQSKWIHFKRKQLHHFHFASIFNAESTSKGKNLLPLQQILSFKSGPLFGRVSLSREANRMSGKLFPFVNMAGTWRFTHMPK